jgi:hypothetical protein
MLDQFLRAGPFLGILLFVSCAAAMQTRQSQPQKTVLAIGQSVTVPNTKVTVSFQEVVEDSRCPTGVTCIWAGDAAVKISIKTTDGSASSYTLHTDAQSGRAAEHEGYRVELLTVTPHPSGDSPPRRQDYRITLSVEQK